jgi:alkanesulfonate monooxygenase SsuD/methylene tetrahydromethanopterin reductase-like flavin-dependent oxidoreductase (luciferase family)
MAALEKAHIVTLVPTDAARAVIDRYKVEWARLGHTTSLPLMVVMRHVVLAETDAAASTTAERAYRSWLGHMRLLWDEHGMDFPLPLPPRIGPLVEVGAAFVGTASGFRDFIAAHVEAIGADCQLKSWDRHRIIRLANSVSVPRVPITPHGGPLL